VERTDPSRPHSATHHQPITLPTNQTPPAFNRHIPPSHTTPTPTRTHPPHPHPPRRALKHAHVVPGGGAVDMEVSRALRDHARTIPGKAQLFIASYAKALEAIPRQLCDNAVGGGWGGKGALGEGCGVAVESWVLEGWGEEQRGRCSAAVHTTRRSVGSLVSVCHPSMPPSHTTRPPGSGCHRRPQQAAAEARPARRQRQGGRDGGHKGGGVETLGVAFGLDSCLQPATHPRTTPATNYPHQLQHLSTHRTPPHPTRTARSTLAWT